MPGPARTRPSAVQATPRLQPCHAAPARPSGEGALSTVVRVLERDEAGLPRHLRDLVARVVAFLPAGADLTSAEFERRHSGILYLLWAQAVGVFVFGLVQRQS